MRNEDRKNPAFDDQRKEGNRPSTGSRPDQKESNRPGQQRPGSEQRRPGRKDDNNL